ncbi:Ipk2 inositol polyphosphate multikinase [Candida orthopsilosis Co 90-125]|uniref:Kinase n=1 Tax=Candida orthopsilosis (strain 90-125) TaxID=1136231 RepID=H8X350_CANO9|nr:Ipk2 inositol polyphosphate multikinase [Candida orthopsilosis Co 90-125]CCG25910.1 Ipk2 inositol polyphosphate multikinase [Candida orthopsilosis Co 90-125]
MDSFNSSTLPFKASKHQAAGHDGCMTSDSLFIKPTTRQELDFYTETVRRDVVKEESSEEGVPLGTLLSHWMPTFLGSLQKGELSTDSISGDLLTSSAWQDNALVQDDKEYIVLSNLYHGFKKPSILDIKLGSRLTDDAVTPLEKIQRLQKVSESTTSGSHSFRICGMKVYNGDDETKPNELFTGMNNTIAVANGEYGDDSSESKSSHKYLVYDKFFGRSLDSKTIQQGLKLYFKPILSNKPIFVCLLTNLILRLQLIFNCLLDCDTRMYSASLLFIYESDPEVLSQVAIADYQDHDPLVKEFDLSDDDDDDDDDGKDEDKDKDEGEGEEEDGSDADAVDSVGLDNVAKAYNIVKQANSESVDPKGEKNASRTPLSSLHLIDFAHSKYVDGEGYDENVVEGVENLIKILEDIKSSY